MIISKETYKKVVSDEAVRLKKVLIGSEKKASKVFLLAIKDACDLLLEGLGDEQS